MVCEDFKYEMNHIVDANDSKDASDRLINFYSNKNVEFSESYWININYCNEVIF